RLDPAVAGRGLGRLRPARLRLMGGFGLRRPRLYSGVERRRGWRRADRRAAGLLCALAGIVASARSPARLDAHPPPPDPHNLRHPPAGSPITPNDTTAPPPTSSGRSTSPARRR